MLTLEMLDSETEYWQSGRDRDTITILHVTPKTATPTKLPTSTTLKTSKDCGPMFTTHMERTPRDQSDSSNMVTMGNLKEFNTTFNILSSLISSSS